MDFVVLRLKVDTYDCVKEMESIGEQTIQQSVSMGFS
jgi:hypothetical protein